ncbi:replication protein, partial (plasmid) [Xanthomonas citri pv. citri]
VSHYQRSIDNVPVAWQKKTGRVWGKCGHWPVQEALKINLQDQHGDGGWFAYRRLIRSWRLADARSAGDAYRIRSARRMLQVSDPVRARLIGFMEWMPFEVQIALLANLATRGYEIQSV